ncbi:MAG: tripartite tricarboxylate transporter permease [Candidatus Rokubacteria bacterium]|nr:tripartite tricarboxylate transporter permease [Candidatus Rokubacteria bacterium]
MDILSHLANGLAIALSPGNLFYCFVGVLIGTLVGVLPGVGPIAGMSLLIPATFGMHPTTAMIMLAGIYYGAMYGGSTTSILINVPGEAASVVTSLDGYQMARAGRAGPALAMAAIGSFVAGTFSILMLMLLAPPFAQLALKFGPAEYAAVMILGFVLLAYLVQGSMLKALMVAAFGLLLGTVGIEPMSGYRRFAFGRPELWEGIGFVPVAMGLFGIAEVLVSVERASLQEVIRTKLRHLWPSQEDWKDSIGAILRGSVLGFAVGILPGPATVLASFTSYTVEKRVSRHPERFGRGAIEGVAGPEAANNAATGGAMVPLLALGIPFAPATAVMMGALMIHGVRPGPLLIEQRPDFFWGVIVSMYIGNFMLLILNLPLVGLFASLLRVPGRFLHPLIVLFCLVGVYSINYSVFDVWVMILFGLLGYVLRKGGFEVAPLVLALVLGPVFETSLRQSLIMSRGDLAVFLRRPLAAGLLLVALALVLTPLLRHVSGRLLAVAGREDLSDRDRA